jgi:outer membrane protein assembly factor BamB
MSIAMPRLNGNLLFVCGVRTTAALLRLGEESTPTAEVVWRGRPKSALYSSNSTPFFDGDTIYGCNENDGTLVAVDTATGGRLWETADHARGKRGDRYSMVFLVKQGDRFVLFNEHGELIFARLDREGYHEIGRAQLLEPLTPVFGRFVVWSHPAYAERCVFARNDQELVCADLTAGGPNGAPK